METTTHIQPARVPLINREMLFRQTEPLLTVGAVAGVLLAGFYFIERVGLSQTVQLAAALSIVVGFIAFFVSSREQIHSSPSIIKATTSSTSTDSPNTLLAIMGLSGALGLSLEVLWTRLLIQGIGSTAYVFAVVLALFLIGIALGSYFVRKHVDRWQDLHSALAMSQALVALFTIIGIPIITWVMPPLVSGIMRAMGTNPQQAFFLAWSMFCTGALLPATIALGASFPLAARLIIRDRKSFGFHIGRLYAVNTYGGVVGSLLTGFLLLPVVGVYWTISLIAALYGVLALVLAYRPTATAEGRRYALLPVGLALAAWIGLSPEIVRNRIVAYTPGNVIEYKEDYYGSIVVTEEGGGQPYKRLSVNGVSYSGTAPYAMHYMRLQGHLPAIMSQAHDKKALVICLGVGLTAGSITTHPNTSLTVVELSKSIVGLSELFADVNEKVHLKPDVKLVTDDGRNYLVRNPAARFDIITLEPPPPVHAGMANLYSVDFYNLVRQRLSPNGVAVQWIPLHTQSNEDSRMLVATFVKSFPHSTLWWTESGEALILGQIDGRPLPLGHIQSALANKTVSQSLAEIGIDTAAELASHLLMDEGGLQRFVQGAEIMTDDLPIIEYRVPAINTNYKAFLEDVIQYRPSNERIAALLGLGMDEVAYLSQAWETLNTKWMEHQLY